MAGGHRGLACNGLAFKLTVAEAHKCKCSIRVALVAAAVCVLVGRGRSGIRCVLIYALQSQKGLRTRVTIGAGDFHVHSYVHSFDSACVSDGAEEGSLGLTCCICACRMKTRVPPGHHMHSTDHEASLT